MSNEKGIRILKFTSRKLEKELLRLWLLFFLLLLFVDVWEDIPIVRHICIVEHIGPKGGSSYNDKSSSRDPENKVSIKHEAKDVANSPDIEKTRLASLADKNRLTSS
ncbi:hypothetical protein DFH29DRAFT_880941 [Suillus ampliporus]|nr:hypothetical protein DFH29DRAFT_880941 [Suillus ampliporus]